MVLLLVWGHPSISLKELLLRRAVSTWESSPIFLPGSGCLITLKVLANKHAMLLQTNLQTAGFRVKVAGGWDKEDARPQKKHGRCEGSWLWGGLCSWQTPREQPVEILAPALAKDHAGQSHKFLAWQLSSVCQALLSPVVVLFEQGPGYAKELLCLSSFTDRWKYGLLF